MKLPGALSQRRAPDRITLGEASRVVRHEIDAEEAARFDGGPQGVSRGGA